MDIEKTMQFLLEQQARFDARQAESEERSKERMSRIENVMLEVANAQERTNVILATLTERHVALEQSHVALTERHVELAQSHVALAQSHKELSEAQKITEQNLNRLIVAVERHIESHA